MGGEYWSDLGVFRNGFEGFVSVFVIVFFFFGGIELVGFVVVELENFEKLVFKVCK